MGTTYRRPGTTAIWIDYVGPNGQRVRETTEQADDGVARRILARREREVAAGTWAPAPVRAARNATIGGFAELWIASVHERKLATARSYEQRTRDHLLPMRIGLAGETVGSLRLTSVRPKTVIKIVEALKRRVEAGELAPRTALHVFDCLRCLLREAVIEEILPANPARELPKGTLPKKRDRDPTWRARAKFSRDEVEALISDERVPEDRRVFYALAFLGGMRPGEDVGRRWSDWDPSRRPLGQLLIATQQDAKELKTKTPREMPVHPTLAKILAGWKLSGWPKWFGRAVRPDDWIVPSRRGPEHIAVVDSRWAALQGDLERLGFRRRRTHDARRTFVSLCRDDGGRADVLEACTHASSGDVFDEYTTFDWATKCAEIAKLRIGLRGSAPIAALPGGSRHSRGTVRNEPRVRRRKHG